MAHAIPRDVRVRIPWQAPVGCPEELKYHWTGYPINYGDESTEGEGEPDNVMQRMFDVIEPIQKDSDGTFLWGQWLQIRAIVTRSMNRKWMPMRKDFSEKLAEGWRRKWEYNTYSTIYRDGETSYEEAKTEQISLGMRMIGESPEIWHKTYAKYAAIGEKLTEMNVNDNKVRLAISNRPIDSSREEVIKAYKMIIHK